jgi:uncharacterized protein
MLKTWALALLLPTLLLGAAPIIDRPVVDARGLLSAQDEEAVASALVSLREQTGAQMAVLLIDTTGGEPIEDYALRAAEQWRGGQAGRDDGLLLVLAAEDRRMRLEVGYGLEAALPDDAVRQVLDAQGPRLRQRDYRGAVLDIIQQVRSRLSGEAQAPEPAPVSVKVPRSNAVEFFGFMAWVLTSLAAGTLASLCLTDWRERLGPKRRAWVFGALAVALVGGPFLLEPWSYHSALGLGFAGLVFTGLAVLLIHGGHGVGLRRVGYHFLCMALLSAAAGKGILLDAGDVVFVIFASVFFTFFFGVPLLFVTSFFIDYRLGAIVAMGESIASSGRGISRGGSSGRKSSFSSSSSSSSSRSSSNRSSSGGGGRFGGGGASSSW